MSPKIKSRSTDEKASAGTVQPPVVHDATNQTTPAKPFSHRPLMATQPASGAANHARHHVSRRTQS